jgi:XRE family transcriptional regulator, fatty acid utilization regulator
MATQLERIILGLKIRQLRQERGWNFEEMSQRTGISVSYLNEIEKGKKYPQTENQKKLARSLGVTTGYLTSPTLDQQYGPLGDLLRSNFLNELPLDLFGIDLQQVVEIIARAPDKVNAFISALIEIARNYSLRDEHFFFAALRAYQELHLNFFEEIETAAEQLVAAHDLPTEGGVGAEALQGLLESAYGYTIDPVGLGRYSELGALRSVFNPKQKKLLLHPRLNANQRAFQLAKELGFNVLQLHERPLASSLLRVKSFEETLNNYKAAYFAVAVLVHRSTFVPALRAVFERPTWSAQAFLDLMQRYAVSPEVLFQRFNLLSVEFGLQKVFFQRFIHNLETDQFDIDKELHLNRRHQPHASGLSEHYCRRWLSLRLLRDLYDFQKQQNNPNAPPVVGVQRSRFLDSDEEYLCIAVAKSGHPTPHRNVAVMIGILLDDHARAVIRFADDPAVPTRWVNITCQRCSVADCAERVAPPTVVERRLARKRTLDVLKKVTGEK